MKRSFITVLLTIGIGFAVNAAEKVLFQSQFESAKPLAGWMDVKKKTPDAKTYKIIEKDGVKCLETPAIYFGIAQRPLRHEKGQGQNSGKYCCSRYDA